MYIMKTNEWIFSSSDLTQFMLSPFASWMEHLAVSHPHLLPMPDEKDELQVVLQNLGSQHEFELLSSFKDAGFTIADVSNKNDSFNATLAAMASGADIIYQAHLELSPFKGYADFLIKIAGRSCFGDYQYEVWDTKLAKSPKPYFLVQLCCYTEMLAVMQGVRSHEGKIILGDKSQIAFKIANGYYFYQNLKYQFLAMHSHVNPNKQPDPALSRAWGRWSNYVLDSLNTADHLSQVATITSGQIKKLYKNGLFTMAALADADCKMIKGMKPEIFNRLKTQAKLQKDSIGKNPPLYQFLSNALGEKKGLALLPPDSPGDVFFDIEGFPLQEGGGRIFMGGRLF